MACGWTSTAATTTAKRPDGYAAINLQPGCQKLNGSQALGFVRWHTDSDLYRNARQQSFVRALKDQILELAFKLPKVIKAMTSNIEVAQEVAVWKSDGTLAVLGHSLRKDVFRSRIDGLEGYADLATSRENTSALCVSGPTVESPKKAAVALSEKVRPRPTARGERDRSQRQRRAAARHRMRATFSGSVAIDPDAAERHSCERAVVRLLHQDLLRFQTGGQSRRRQMAGSSAPPMCRRRPRAHRPRK